MIWPARTLDVLRALQLPLPGQGVSVVLRPNAGMRITVPHTPVVLILAAAPPGEPIRAVAYGLGREVAQISSDTADSQAVIALRFEADLIDAVEITGQDLQVAGIGVALPEPCESTEGWEPIGSCPTCLPVTHDAYGCGRERADELEALARLPDDPDIRARFDGGNLDDLLQTMRAAVDPARGATMASRPPDLPASDVDCPPIGTEVPQLQFGALDVLLIAGVDPMVARMLGLYYVDADAVPGRRYDYKVVGVWPEGTLWSLDNSISFDARAPGETLSGAWSEGDIAFALNRSARVVAVPTNIAGTTHALSVLPDVFDWGPLFQGLSGATPRLVLRFPRPVGEVQVYARHSGETLRLRAMREGVEVARDDSTSQEAILAAHAPGGIDTLLVEGELHLLLRIDWGIDYIPEGRHCHVAYGLTAGPPAPLAAPHNVRAVALRGVTRKQNDCEPIGDGALADTRHLVGVRWLAPQAPDATLLPTDPIRYRVEREGPNGTRVPVGDGGLVTVVPADTVVDVNPLDWPAERQHVVDVVPGPGAYRYRVEGLDIFGRVSGFGNWSERVQVRPIEPPPPSGVVARWLDEGDPNLTADERAWVDGANAGLLVRWEWLSSQERQAPFAESFLVLVERGWLNLVRGATTADPVDSGGGAFSVNVEVDRALPANALAGTTMSRDGTPYRVRSSTATGGGPPLLTTLECVQPASGVPRWRSGSDVAIPLVLTVRGQVEKLDLGPGGGRRSLGVLIGDLRASPPNGFAGGTVLAGEHRWPIVAAAVVSAAGDGLRVSLEIQAANSEVDLPFLYALLNQRVAIELPPPPPYVDYRNPAHWSASAGQVPLEGPGTYEVFVRHVVGTETAGRTSVAPRTHRILTASPLFDMSSIAYGQVSLATVLGGAAGAAATPASFVRVDRMPPASPDALPPGGATQPGDVAAVYTSVPDYTGRSSFHYRWPRVPGVGYVVYRGFDETLFAIDRRVRGTRSKVRADWNGYLGQFPDPEGVLLEKAFHLFIEQAEPPDYASLDPRNRLLQILASFPDVLDAYTRLNPEPIAWDDPAHADKATETAGPGETPDSPLANVRLYTDRTLPAQGTSAYFYRVAAVDALGNAGPMSIATAPVWLRPAGVPPRRPALTNLTAGDRRLTVTWAVSREPGLAEYVVYRADTADAAADVMSMAPVHTMAVTVSDPAVRPATASFVDGEVALGHSYWYRVAARGQTVLVADGARQTVIRESEPSEALTSIAVRMTPPAPPAWGTIERLRTVTGSEVRLRWASGEHGLTSTLQRRMPGAAWRDVAVDLFPSVGGSWEYVDEATEGFTTYEYRVRVRDGAGNRNLVDDVLTLPAQLV